VGERTLALAQRVVHRVAQVLAPDCAPLLLTDGFRAYLTALLSHYGQWVQPARGPMARRRPPAGCPGRAPLCARGQDRAAAPCGPRTAPGRVRHASGGAAGTGRLRLAE